MKISTLLLSIFITSAMFSQDNTKLLNPDLDKFIMRCQSLGESLTNKSIKTDLDTWYEGHDKQRALQHVNRLESDIDQSNLKVTYYLILMNENPWIYTFHFYNEETKAQFGQLFINFTDKDNDLVDYIAFVSKEKLAEIDNMPKDDSGFLVIPPPPPPPAPAPPVLKKKN